MAKKIGLALGAGSARGLSLIGVLKAFRESGIRPGICSRNQYRLHDGGGVYAAGNLDAVEELMRHITPGQNGQLPGLHHSPASAHGR